MLLPLPAEKGARLVALELVDEAKAAVGRLEAGDDAEALHDFRVALRRLRSLLRAYRPFVDVKKAQRGRLRDLAAATGAGRDSEVALEWLEALPAAALKARERPGLVFLLGRLRDRRDGAYAELRNGVAARFTKLRAKLEPPLLRYEAAVRDGDATTFAAATADLVAAHARELEEHLAGVKSAADEIEAHEARIAAKRLRYVLEPLRDEVAAIPGIIKQMKGLQELLGQMHDVSVLAAELPAAIEAAAAQRARDVYERALGGAKLRGGPRDPHPGLLAIGRLLRERRDALFAELSTVWLGDGVKALVEAIGNVVGQMAQRVES